MISPLCKFSFAPFWVEIISPCYFDPFGSNIGNLAKNSIISARFAVGKGGIYPPLLAELSTRVGIQNTPQLVKKLSIYGGVRGVITPHCSKI